MKVYYATTARLPTVHAHGQQIVENCAAFAAAGADVTLVIADRGDVSGFRSRIDPRDHYGVPSTFALDRAFCLEPRWQSRFLQPTAFRIMTATFGFGLLAALRRCAPNAVVYSRDPLPLVILSLALPAHRLVYEAHQLPMSRKGRALFAACVRRVGLVVAVTDQIAAAARVAGAHVAMVARDGYRADRYDTLPSRGSARRELGLPEGEFLIGYVGRLHTMGMAKGVEQLLDAVARLPESPVTVAVVGGPADHVEALRRRWRRLGQPDHRLVAPGQVASERVPLWLAALDVGAIPFPVTPHFARCASPLKMFEYLAAGLPIVASNLPALAEVLVDGESALLTPPEDVEALTAALDRLRRDPVLRATLAAGARRAAGDHTWTNRARNILDAIRKLHS